MLESLHLLIACDKTITENIFDNLNIDAHLAEERLFKSPAITTALSPYIGYNKASEIAKLMKKANINVFEANDILQLIATGKLKEILKPDNLLKTGYSINDLL